ncbi:MAG: HDOD domain-containing protein [Steroidobacteraceae bacterium]
MTDPLDREEILKAASTIGLLQLRNTAGSNLLAALCDLRADAREIAALVDREPGLAARVLRVANSAFYGLARSVTTIERALVVLGIDAVRGIAAASCMDRGLQRPGENLVIDLVAVVRHCIGTAIAAESLARLGPRRQAGEAFMAGLLHNLGLPIQARLDQSGMQQVVATLAADPNASIRDLESMHVRVGHEHCGGVLFESWNLPSVLCDAARHHHAPFELPPGENRTVALLVHVAAGYAARALTRPAAEPLTSVDEERCLATLGIERQPADQALEALAARVDQLMTA